MKKNLKIIIIVLVIVAVVGGAYILWLFLSDDDSEFYVPWRPPEEFPEASRVERPPATTLPEGQVVFSEEKPGLVLSRISDEGVFAFYSWKNEKNGVFYIANDGLIKKGVLGTDEAVSHQTINALASAEASPGGNYVLASFGSPLNLSWAVFGLNERSWRMLSQVVTATWGGDDKQLFAIQKDGDQRHLVSIDVSDFQSEDFSASVVTRNLLLKDVSLKYVQPHVFIMERPSGKYEGFVWQLNVNDGLLAPMFGRSLGLWLEWSRDKTFAFRFSSPDFFRIKAHGRTLVPISTPFKTVPNKCDGLRWAVYCFVPSEELFPPSPAMVMPDEYLRKGFFTLDYLVFYDLSLDRFELVFRSGDEEIPTIDATSVFFSKDSLYFINRYDAGLYKLTLPENLHPSLLRSE